MIVNQLAMRSEYYKVLVIAGMVLLGSTLLLGQSTDLGALSQSLSQLPPSFSGSVPSGQATSTAVELSLRDALELGLKQNLGLIEGTQDIRNAQAARLRALSKLLPDINASVTESVQQNNLAAFGLPPIPGVPTIVGPFSLSDARASLSQSLVDLSLWHKEKASSLDQEAAKLSYVDAREIVVVVIADLYLQAVASSARVDAAQSQLATAQTAYEQATNMRKAGLVAGIDALRSQVELQSRQQQLLAAKNRFAKDKLDLARAIGLPGGQEFNLADKMPYAPAPVVTLEKALADAYSHRADFQRAEALVHSAEAGRRGASAENLPTLGVQGNYGDIGRTFAHSHGTFSTAASLNIPIFQGGKVRADTLQADALLQRRRAELEDTRGKIDSEVRKAFLDVQAASDQVAVTGKEIELANETLNEARDRFAAGVTNNLEVVQAQEALANANETYISSVYSHNIAKASLARSVGLAEKSIREFLAEMH
jgi:outer membrane protein TolC